RASGFYRSVVAPQESLQVSGTALPYSDAVVRTRAVQPLTAADNVSQLRRTGHTADFLISTALSLARLTTRQRAAVALIGMALLGEPSRADGDERDATRQLQHPAERELLVPVRHLPRWPEQRHLSYQCTRRPPRRSGHERNAAVQRRLESGLGLAGGPLRGRL